MDQKIAIFWIRRDLRLHDNHALYQAFKSGLPVLPVFIFDPEILEKINAADDSRVSFIYTAIQKIKAELEKKGSSLRVLYAKPLDAFRELLNDYEIKAVFANKDYEPYSRQRDSEVGAFLKEKGADFCLLKDHVLFEGDEVLKDDGTPYTVFTPYSKKWKQILNGNTISVFPSEKFPGKLLKTKVYIFPGLSDLGFKKSTLKIPPAEVSEDVIRNYAKNRDFPAVKGTTRLGVHLRFGTVSIREVTRKALECSDVFLNELIWRNFYSAILWHFPMVAKKAFKPGYDFIDWRNNEKEFECWCRGETGYPMVDAGMRELDQTGFMHNRARMVTASFLTKHLLIDWR
jgi:deoxyribodipyrimidine photo-lyase